MAKGGHNKPTARWILAVLAQGGWVNPPLLAVLAGYSVRAASSCLRRLHRLGFVQCRYKEGLSLYAVSERGRLIVSRGAAFSRASDANWGLPWG
jgi:hypothetical protein